MSIITNNALIVHSAREVIYYDESAPVEPVAGLDSELSKRVVSGEITLRRARLIQAERYVAELGRV